MLHILAPASCSCMCNRFFVDWWLAGKYIETAAGQLFLTSFDSLTSLELPSNQPNAKSYLLKYHTNLPTPGELD